MGDNIVMSNGLEFTEEEQNKIKRYVLGDGEPTDMDENHLRRLVNINMVLVLKRLHVYHYVLNALTYHLNYSYLLLHFYEVKVTSM